MFFSIYQIQRERERERAGELSLSHWLIVLISSSPAPIRTLDYSLITGALRGAYKASE